MFTVPLGSPVAVIIKVAGLTQMMRVKTCFSPAAVMQKKLMVMHTWPAGCPRIEDRLAVRCNLVVTVWVGVPEMIPVLGSSVRPMGRLPVLDASIPHVNGRVPPVNTVLRSNV